MSSNHEPERLLTLDEASDLVGDDIAFWLNNPFMDRYAIAEKVCWWITRAALTAEPEPEPEGAAGGGS